ncbi:MAG: hypothetical protein WD749_02995 [Phycisphaerales bacterium]
MLRGPRQKLHVDHQHGRGVTVRPAAARLAEQRLPERRRRALAGDGLREFLFEEAAEDEAAVVVPVEAPGRALRVREEERRDRQCQGEEGDPLKREPRSGGLQRRTSRGVPHSLHTGCLLGGAGSTLPV